MKRSSACDASLYGVVLKTDKAFTLWDGIETVFLATAKEYSFLSSSIVKEIAKFGGSVAHLVPENVAQDITLYYS